MKRRITDDDLLKNFYIIILLNANNIVFWYVIVLVFPVTHLSPCFHTIVRTVSSQGCSQLLESTVVDLSTRPAFLIDFRKIQNFDGKKTFSGPKLIKKFKFYIRMIISGGKSVKKSQNNSPKATISTNTYLFFLQQICLS